MLITIEGWDPVDRQPVRGELHSVDRAQTQAADIVTVSVTPPGDDNATPATVVLKQNPSLLQRQRPGEIRVGACVWDSGYVLSALLEQMAARGELGLKGARCVELGAGCALVGLVAARLGASVMCTDKQEVLVHARGNAAKNKLLWMPQAPGPAAARQQQQQEAANGSGSGEQHIPPPGSVGVMPLDWCAPDAAEAAVAVREGMGGPVDFVLASDSIYPDPTGCETNAKGFIQACAALCGPKTRVLITYEWRLPEVRAALLGAARATFPYVRVLPQEELPEGWRTTHVETFEMGLVVPV